MTSLQNPPCKDRFFLYAFLLKSRFLMAFFLPALVHSILLSSSSSDAVLCCLLRRAFPSVGGGPFARPWASRELPLRVPRLILGEVRDPVGGILAPLLHLNQSSCNAVRRRPKTPSFTPTQSTSTVSLLISKRKKPRRSLVRHSLNIFIVPMPFLLSRLQDCCLQSMLVLYPCFLTEDTHYTPPVRGISSASRGTVEFLRVLSGHGRDLAKLSSSEISTLVRPLYIKKLLPLWGNWLFLLSFHTNPCTVNPLLQSVCSWDFVAEELFNMKQSHLTEELVPSPHHIHPLSLSSSQKYVPLLTWLTDLFLFLRMCDVCRCMAGIRELQGWGHGANSTKVEGNLSEWHW